MNYARVVTEFRNRVWAVQEETFSSMAQLVERWSRGEKFSEEEVGARIRDANYGLNRGEGSREPAMLAVSGGSTRSGAASGSRSGIVALIPVLGVIANRANMFSIYTEDCIPNFF